MNFAERAFGEYCATHRLGQMLDRLKSGPSESYLSLWTPVPPYGMFKINTGLQKPCRRDSRLTNKVTDFVRDIRDPEHPYSLEQLSVLSEESITVDEKLGRILITFTPTIQHCSMATVIGLCLRVKLMGCFPPHYKVDIKVSPGSHANEESVNKQLNDKERVAAALENPNLRQLVDECLYSNEL
ncbi:hypothetical protein NE237_023615 [Protea cynaroides]|uniref:MIP18 family-like domain-containing protein n=1 Tax=Protea cynaroides TaxID=273540 RepID=A0A9Q0K5B8_9MAGN|nr:hypothetical protein NE237_023615 [Protea cynaroides]